MTVRFITETKTEWTDVPQAKGPRKQVRPHAAHIQPCYNQEENRSGVPVGGGETEV